ncbi:MAG: phosphatase PAP2 family protein [bacterium]
MRPWLQQCLVVVLLILGWNNIILAEEADKLATVKKLVVRVGYDATYIINSPLRMDSGSVKKLLLFSGISYGLMAVDDRLNRELTKIEYEKIGKYIEPLGVTHREFYLTMGTLYLSGLASKNSKLKKTSMLLSEAVLFNGSLTRFFKDIFGRPRPFQQVGERNWDDFYPFSGYDAFPSGHTSTAFTLTTVISHQYPSRWVKVTGYTIASLVGLQRLNSDVHGIADVFAGAVLGIWVGNTVCSLDKAWEKGDIQISSQGLRIRF